jgi:DNA invertase Pin-like site-specific DNA recombinase
MMALLQNFEVEQLRERIGASMSYLRKQNRRISGHIPFGYDLAADNDTLVTNEQERESIQEIKLLRAKGHSLWQIARHLDSIGVRTKRKARWSATAIRGILIRESRLSA